MTQRAASTPSSATAGSDSKSRDTSDREIVITREIAAPRELVFEAFTDAKHISNWWGPNGFSTTTHEKDVRPGGVWRFIMHGPDGTDHVNRIRYTEVVRPERLVYDHDDDGIGVHPPFKASVTFVARGERTVVTLRLIVATPEIREQFRKFGAVEGGEQTLERLEAFLAQQQ